MSREVVIAGACRTALGKFLGSLSGFKATELGSKVAAAALERAGVKPDQVDEVIFGNVLQAGLGQNPEVPRIPFRVRRRSACWPGCRRRGTPSPTWLSHDARAPPLP